MKAIFPAKIPLKAAGQKLNLDRRPCLHSDKEGPFCPCFEHFLDCLISEISIDKVLNLLKWSESHCYRVIYWVKSRSQEGGKS